VVLTTSASKPCISASLTGPWTTWYPDGGFAVSGELPEAKTPSGEYLATNPSLLPAEITVASPAEGSKSIQDLKAPEIYTFPDPSVVTPLPWACEPDGNTFAHWCTPEELCLSRNVSFLSDTLEVKLLVPDPESRSAVPR